MSQPSAPFSFLPLQLQARPKLSHSLVPVPGSLESRSRKRLPGKERGGRKGMDGVGRARRRRLSVNPVAGGEGREDVL